MADEKWTDEELRRLYAEWSEEYYAAGWMSCQSPAEAEPFVRSLLTGTLTGEPRGEWTDYERETIRHIRTVLSREQERHHDQ